jgi:hypothetical protein
MIRNLVFQASQTASRSLSFARSAQADLYIQSGAASPLAILFLQINPLAIRT